MKVIDMHCDALFKMQVAKRDSLYHKPLLNFTDAKELDTNFQRLQAGGVKVQFFAIFLHPELPSDEQWQHALEQVDLFHTEIIGKNPQMRHIASWQDINELKDDEIGAVLTLEGAEPVGNDLAKLRHLFRLGVLSVGLTWNYANLCADGAGEPRGAGLTLFGKDVVRANNENRIFTDVSHLSEKSFWDVMELAEFPFASHSNARALCNHARNLTDEQARAMFRGRAMINVVFFPSFINTNSERATTSDLIRHIDHFCSMGGVEHIGFGSDFDGIKFYTDNLKNAGDYPKLINELQKHYTETEVEGFAYRNFLAHLPI
ncbi:dipeptidase [Planomicrobium sp. Y74]|uniref:dipeptidase n=1 Tax=Planomicrobium sp. Y74 TaxID=2478977 RepID=UPI000EF458AC|nr:dipeptidase [Planomicrobium sp. Y74]RLQ90422.1 membrane dipeptidase [Planomicrobium sp. Y74]